MLLLADLPGLVGALVCHRIPDRSFTAGSVPPAFCARCLGIYMGFGLAIAAILALSRTVPRGAPRGKNLVVPLILALITFLTFETGPLAIPAIAQWKLIRFSSGVLLGAAIAEGLLPAALALLSGKAPAVSGDGGCHRGPAQQLLCALAALGVALAWVGAGAAAGTETLTLASPLLRGAEWLALLSLAVLYGLVIVAVAAVLWRRLRSPASAR